MLAVITESDVFALVFLSRVVRNTTGHVGAETAVVGVNVFPRKVQG